MMFLRVPTLAALAWTIVCVVSAPAATVVVPGDYPTLPALRQALLQPGAPAIDTVLVTTALELANLDWIGVERSILFRGVPAGDGALPILDLVQFSNDLVSEIGFENLHFRGEFFMFQGVLRMTDCRLDGGLQHPDSEPGDIRITRCSSGPITIGANAVLVVDSCEVTGQIICRTGGEVGIYGNHIVGTAGTGVFTEGRTACTIARNRIEGFDRGIAASTADGPVSILDNVVEGCAEVGILSSVTWDVAVERNRVRACQLGIFVSSGGAMVRDNFVADCSRDGMVLTLEEGVAIYNVVARSGRHGFYLENPSSSGRAVLYNTTYSNLGSGFVIEGQASGDVTRFSNNISYGNQGYGLELIGSVAPISGCNDWFANVSGDVSGASVSPTDLAVDPDFCNLSEYDAHLIETSALLDVPTCGLIGALAQGCVATAALDARLTAERLLDGVRLRWQVSGGTLATEIALERAESVAGPWAAIAAEISRDAGESVALDRDALPGRAYWYRLRAFDRGEWQALGEPVFVATGSAPRFALLGVTPNPGAGPVRVTFSLPRAAAVDLDVFDVLGRHVASLAHGPHAAGTHIAEWLARGDKAPTGPGIYLVRYRHPEGQQAGRFVRTK